MSSKVGTKACRFYLLVLVPVVASCSSKVTSAAPVSGPVFNVLAFGAKGDGKSDDILAFRSAFAAACQGPTLESATVLVPSGKKFLVSTFSLDNCTTKALTWQVNGKILAPADPSTWPKPTPINWLSVNNIPNFTVRGAGTIDGQGQIWWRNATQKRPRTLTFNGCDDLTVEGIRIMNGAFFLLNLNRSSRATVHRVRVTSPADSPNTDGIHTSSIVNVTITNSRISTGDDNISIQNGTRNLFISNCFFGTGHGVSIGSLGAKNSTGCVSNVTVQNSIFVGTQNGVRIKTWQGGHGAVTNILYSNLRMTRVAFPINFNQFYCDRLISKSGCEQVTSPNATVISGVVFRRITGTYANSSAYDSNIGEDYSYSKPAVLKCSGRVPCQISVQSVSFKNAGGTRRSVPVCQNVYGDLGGSLPGCNVTALPLPPLAAMKAAAEIEVCRKRFP